MFVESRAMEAAEGRDGSFEFIENTLSLNGYLYRVKIINCGTPLQEEKKNSLVERINRCLLEIFALYSKYYPTPMALQFDGERLFIDRGGEWEPFSYRLSHFSPLLRVEASFEFHEIEKYYSALEGQIKSGKPRVSSYLPIRSSRLSAEEKEFFIRGGELHYTHLISSSFPEGERAFAAFSALLVVSFMQNRVKPADFLGVVNRGSEWAKSRAIYNRGDLKRRLEEGVAVLGRLFYNSNQAHLQKVVADSSAAFSFHFFLRLLLLMALDRDEPCVKAVFLGSGCREGYPLWKEGILKEVNRLGVEPSSSAIAILRALFAFDIFHYQSGTGRKRPAVISGNSGHPPLKWVALLESGKEYYLVFNGKEFQFR